MKMLRWPTVLVVAFAAAVAFVVGGIALLTAAFRTGAIPTSTSLPPYATPAALERTFEPQFDRLIEMALNPELRVTNGPGALELFAAPEILEAKIEVSPNSFRGATDRIHSYRSRLSAFETPPEVGRAVANRYWDELFDGSKVQVVEYHRRLIDRDGNEVGAILLFDLHRLSAAGQARDSVKR